MFARQSKEVNFDTLLTSPIDLQQGINLVGIVDPPVDASAFDVLSNIGYGNVASIQRYNWESGAFETAAYDTTGQIDGVDFPIVTGEGYILHMRQAVTGFQLP